MREHRLDELLSLIRDFRIAVAATVAQLQQELGEDDLLGGWRQHRYPQGGPLRDGAKYQFHGIGCCVTRNDLDVDFDFGTDGRIDGFDAWRLYRFAEQRPESYPHLQEWDAVEGGLEMLLRSGIAVASEDNRNQLVYLNEEAAKKLEKTD